MKLVRYGAKGAEKPGLIDKSGQLRDLSAHVKDLTGEAYSPESLTKLAALDPASLPAVSGKPRFGDPSEFGAACAFLCSAQAGYITGQNLLIDGGVFNGAF